MSDAACIICGGSPAPAHHSGHPLCTAAPDDGDPPCAALWDSIVNPPRRGLSEDTLRIFRLPPPIGLPR